MGAEAVALQKASDQPLPPISYESRPNLSIFWTCLFAFYIPFLTAMVLFTYSMAGTHTYPIS
jgi:hypothetical protein